VNADFWLPILSLVFSVGSPAALFVARNWIIARISKGVQHEFDVKLEELRAELRKMRSASKVSCVRGSRRSEHYGMPF
jgi:hypothetical protein